MANSDQRTWDKRYLAGEFDFRDPDSFVREAHEKYFVPLLSPRSTGLDLAGGAGQHAIWLAQRGWHMTLVDWSKVALENAPVRPTDCPGEGNVEIVHGAALDVVANFHRERRQFGFVLVSFFLDRAVLPYLPKILISGGLLLYRTYTEDNERLGNSRGPRNSEYLLRSQELLEVYRDMKILHYNETVTQKGVAELIAQQPVN